MTTPDSWHEAARHHLHREQRRPCGQCGPNMRLDYTCPCGLYVHPDNPLTTSTAIHIADCRYAKPAPPRDHDSDCIYWCDGVDCDLLHSCWCAQNKALD